MGNKSKILYFSLLIVNVVCFILDLLPINFPFFRYSFAISLMLIGILLLVRAFTLKIDSSMFIGIVLLGCGILNLVIRCLEQFTDMTGLYAQFWPYYLFAAALASFVTSMYFKDKFQLKLFILFLGFGLISLLYVQAIFNLWWMIGLMIGWFVLYFVVNIVIFRKRRKGLNGQKRGD